MMKLKNFLLSIYRQYFLRLRKLVALPAEYSLVKDLYPASPAYVPPTEFSSYITALIEKFQALIIYPENLSSEFFNQNVYPTGWVESHASLKRGPETAPGINTILLLLRDKVGTFNMQAHLMQLNMKWTSNLKSWSNSY